MSKGGYTIRQLEKADCSLLVPLMKDAFGMDVANDYFQWKYFENPLGNCVGFIAIERNTNSAVSFYGAIPQKYMVDGTERIIYQACDTMTHTQHRKKSLYPVLAQECYELLKKNDQFFMIGIGGSEQSFPVLKHFGWITVFGFRNYFKPSFFCKFSFGKPAKDFVEENSLLPLKELIESSKADCSVWSPGDLAHYEWRIKNPNYQYKIISYRKENAVKGFVVYFIQNNKILLFDFRFSDNTSRKALIGYLSKLVSKNKYKGIVSLCQDGGFQSKLLKKSLFIANPFRKGPLSDRPPFLIFSDRETMEKYADPGKWCITAYDYDAF